jgi:pimeloyl-ACP methyl ester carboxylesterase
MNRFPMGGWLAGLLFLAAGVSAARATCYPADLDLTRGKFSFFHFFFRPPGPLAQPKALILFGSGAAGWMGWEDKVCDHLQADGYEIVGIDFRKYALQDYDLNILQADYQKLTQKYLAPYGNHPPPVILGGWSTGAEQAVAVAGGPNPPGNLAGLILIAPGATGGFGKYATDYIIMNAPADRVFHPVDFASKFGRLRVAQWHAEFDLLDSLKWLKALPGPYREYDFSNAIHDYRDACGEVLTGLSGSVAWILNGNNATLGTRTASFR